MATMSASTDREVVMGPPPLPNQVSVSASNESRPRDNPDITEKYRRLKRKYFELDEVCRSSDLSCLGPVSVY